MHPNQPTLIALLSGRTRDDQAESLFAHVAECGQCQGRITALRDLRADFDGSWTEFETVMAETAGRVLGAPAVTGIRAAFRGVMDAGRRLATAGRETASSLGGTLVPGYSGVGRVPSSDAVAQKLERASDLVALGRPEDALALLDEVAAAEPQMAEVAEIDLTYDDEVCGHVVIDAARQHLSVLVTPRPEFEGGAVTLVTTAGDRQVALAEVEGAPYLLAEFADVEDGLFEIRLDLVPTTQA